MDSNASHSKIKYFVICLLISVITGLILFYTLSYKPPLKTITDEELDAIDGIKITFTVESTEYGVIAKRIKEYIEVNPECKADDLRIIKGVDDFIINQLEERWR